MQRATFRIRGKEDVWLISKRRNEPITRQEVADVLRENDYNCWACDVEDLKEVTNEEEIKRLFEKVENRFKLFM